MTLKRIFKIILKALFFLLIIGYIAFYLFSKPVSNEKIFSDFNTDNVSIFIKNVRYENQSIRTLSNNKMQDTVLPNIVFIHGSIGSAFDFKAYFKDSILNKKANLFAYDRVGYGVNDKGNPFESIEKETQILNEITKSLNPQNTILVGYSYGGPIALASKKNYKKIVLLAPAVYSKVEPMPWALNFYKWKATRWLLPNVWKSASKEKLSHKKDLQKFERQWYTNPTSIVSIHGTSDWIVPFNNSMYLKAQFPKKQLKVIALDNVGHELIWTRFNEIKIELLKLLNE